MHHFVVASSPNQDHVIALCDADGHFYVARASQGGAPALGTRLRGNGPKLGFGLLLGEAMDAVYRVNFEAIDCGAVEALQALQSRRGAELPN